MAGAQLALALDATTWGARFVVLVISVRYRGCAIPVAGAVLPATAKGACRDASCFRRSSTLPPSRQYGGLIWLAGLDRTALQADQTRRLAVVAPAHDVSRAGGVFRRGWSTILVALLRQEPRPTDRLIPEP